MNQTLPLPTRRDEAWRYSDLAALEPVWADIAGKTETIAVPAGETLDRQIVLPAATGNVAIVDLDVTIGKDAIFTLHLLSASAGYGRINVKATLEEGAHFELGGAILGKDIETLEIVTETIHKAPNTTSNQIVRTVLAGRATGTFMGKVHVARHAQKTDAAQSVKAILLDRTATANAKPELEIFADDVKCAHGATVGELDKAALFYMASRGIEPVAAKRLMLQAFIADAFVHVADDAAREEIETKALELLERIS